MNVIVTGASRGIGKSIALLFAEAGHNLVLNARNADRLEQAATEIRKAFPAIDVHVYAANLAQREEVRSFGNFCLEKGSPDVLVNNAGVYVAGNCIDEQEGSLETMMNSNLFSAYHLTRALAPAMMKNRQGHIFNICSVASLQAYPGGGGYSISKFALNGFSQNLRQELMPFGIKVTGVFPGAVFTDSWTDFDNSDQRIMEAHDIAKMIVACTQLSSQAVVEEITLRPLLGDL
jgi:short-subunit dehydrogenase